MNTKQNWREEFDEKFVHEPFGFPIAEEYLPQVKAFITHLLHTQQEEFRKAIHALEQKRGWMPLGKSDDPWNRALEAVLKLLPPHDDAEKLK